MVNSTASSGSNHEKLETLCPKSGNGAHTSVVKGSAPLTAAEMRAALADIDIKPGSRLARSASYRARMANICADDLLQEAIFRAMTSRTCPSSLAVEHFLMGIMRSIASQVIAKRERDIEALFNCGWESADHAMTPEGEIAFAERAHLCRLTLNNIAKGCTEAAIVLDGIDQNLRGKALAKFAGIDRAKLASVRKFIRRRGAAVRACLEEVDEAA